MEWHITDKLYHHGILGMHWGKKNGPPYPLGASDHSASEKKAGWRKSLDGGSNSQSQERRPYKYRRYMKKVNGKYYRTDELPKHSSMKAAKEVLKSAYAVRYDQLHGGRHWRKATPGETDNMPYVLSSTEKNDKLFTYRVTQDRAFQNTPLGKIDKNVFHNRININIGKAGYKLAETKTRLEGKEFVEKHNPNPYVGPDHISNSKSINEGKIFIKNFKKR